MEYYIDFTTTKDNKLEAVKITIEFVKIHDMDKELNIGLCDDPLYPELCRYVKDNPR
jgi:hypothetical protein